MKIQHILGGKGIRAKLDDLDDAPGPYAMSFGFDLKPLCDSIEAVGLVNPPCIAKHENDRMEIITGYRRVLALKRLGWSELTCEDLSSSLPSSRDRFLFAFHENLATRVFNPAEKAMILVRISALYDRQDVLRDFMPLLSLPSHEATLGFYLRLAGMEQEFLGAVAAGKLSLKAARALTEMESRSRTEVLGWISSLMLNFNQQLQFIDMLVDISEIEKRAIGQILEDWQAREILFNTNLNNPQKATRIVDELRHRRSPRWRTAKARFKEKVDSLRLPAGARIDHPAYFEAPGYRLEVHFENGKELAQKLRKITDLSTIEQFGDPLFDIHYD